MAIYCSTPVIDFHAHIYPEQIAPRAIDGLQKYSGLTPKGEGTLSHLLQRGRESGVTHFVVNSVATNAHQVSSINSFVAASAASHPNCYGLGTLHPDMTDEELDEEIRRIMNLGLKGIKLHPDNQHTAADSDGMMRICEKIAGKLPLLIHCGDYRTDLSHPKRVVKLLEANPDLTMIAAHLGGWPMYDLALEYFEDKNCFLDISSSIMLLGSRRSRELVRIYGAQRILFGSDYPIWDPGKSLEEFLSLNLRDEENTQILYGNAKRLLSVND